MNEAAEKKTAPGSELDDPDYLYLLFLQDHGWKYAEVRAKRAAYLREILVRHNKILNEEEFLAEAGDKYADASKLIYPQAGRMGAFENRLTLGTLQLYPASLAHETAGSAGSCADRSKKMGCKQLRYGDSD